MRQVATTYSDVIILKALGKYTKNGIPMLFLDNAGGGRENSKR